MKKINLISHEIELAQSEVLHDLRRSSPEQWGLRRGGGRWEVTADGLRAYHMPDDKMLHGQIFYVEPIVGDVMLEFDARLLPPSSHDLVWLWQTSFEAMPWGEGYLGCLGGWYGDYTGIEKLPTFEPSAIFAAHPLETGRDYRIVSGTVGGIVFIALDGELLLRFADPRPVANSNPGFIGFGFYQSDVEYRNIRISRPRTTPRMPSYE